LEVSGIKDILSKMMGSNNKINNVYATIEALKKLREK
ncbi:MAG: 30S ribosomal protein S5, partial [Patescibacteria group bacterium]|nr:30S ribosomal protein S5 [Patescibacteria group bacterium]